MSHEPGAEAGRLGWARGGSMDGQHCLARWFSQHHQAGADRLTVPGPGADCATVLCLLQCNRPRASVQGKGPGVFASTRTPLSPGPSPGIPPCSTFHTINCYLLPLMGPAARSVWLRPPKYEVPLGGSPNPFQGQTGQSNAVVWMIWLGVMSPRNLWPIVQPADCADMA